MVLTQISTDMSSKSLNLSSNTAKSYSANIANKDSNKVTNSYASSNKSNSDISKKSDFKDVLNSKTQSKKDDKASKSTSVKSDDTKTNEYAKEDKSVIQGLKEKIEELKDKSSDEKNNDNDVNDILSSLLNALNKLLVNNDSDKQNQLAGEQNNILIQTIMDGSQNESKSTQDLLSMILETLSNDDVQSSLDSDALSGIKEILSQLSSNISSDDDNMKDIKNIISDLSSKLSDGNTEGTVDAQTVVKPNTESQTSNDSSEGEESLANNSNGTQSTETNKKVDKEDKFLNKLLNNGNDNAINNINVFGRRIDNVQNVSGNTSELSLNKSTFTADVIKDVKYMELNNLKELTVKVNPGNLGEITIRLISEDGVMKANLKANSKETTELLSQNLAQIKEKVADQNIKVSEVNIELYNDDTTFFKGENFGNGFSQEQERNNGRSSASQNVSNVIFEDEELDENMAEISNNLNYLA